MGDDIRGMLYPSIEGENLTSNLLRKTRMPDAPPHEAMSPSRQIYFYFFPMNQFPAHQLQSFDDFSLIDNDVVVALALIAKLFLPVDWIQRIPFFAQEG